MCWSKKTFYVIGPNWNPVPMGRLETCSDVPMGKISASGEKEIRGVAGELLPTASLGSSLEQELCVCVCVCVYVYGLMVLAYQQTVPTIGFAQWRAREDRVWLILQLSHLTNRSSTLEWSGRWNCQSAAEKLTSFLTTQSTERKGGTVFSTCHAHILLCNMSLRSGNE